MINDFAKTILNRRRVKEDNSLFAQEYTPSKELSFTLNKIHDIFFISGSSVNYDDFLLLVYLRLLEAFQVTVPFYYDHRVDYDLDKIKDFTKSPNISVAKDNNTNVNVFVTGTFLPSRSDDSVETIFLVEQKSGSGAVTIFSNNDAAYLKGSEKFLSQPAAEIILQSGGPNESSLIKIGDYAIFFKLLENISVLPISNQKWTITAVGNYNVDLLNIYEQLNSNFQYVKRLLAAIGDHPLFRELEYYILGQDNPLLKLVGILCTWYICVKENKNV